MFSLTSGPQQWSKPTTDGDLWNCEPRWILLPYGIYVRYFVTASKGLDKRMSRDILRVPVNSRECHFHWLAPARPFEAMTLSAILQGEDLVFFSTLSETLTNPWNDVCSQRIRCRPSPASVRPLLLLWDTHLLSKLLQARALLYLIWSCSISAWCADEGATTEETGGLGQIT